MGEIKNKEHKKHKKTKSKKRKHSNGAESVHSDESDNYDFNDLKLKSKDTEENQNESSYSDTEKERTSKYKKKKKNKKQKNESNESKNDKRKKKEKKKKKKEKKKQKKKNKKRDVKHSESDSDSESEFSDKEDDLNHKNNPSKIWNALDDSTKFSKFGLDARLLRGIRKLGFRHPTLVQSASIPLALQGKDILAKARTGSGKTAAYVIPIVQTVLTDKMEKEDSSSFPRALILVPSSELCDQVSNHFDTLARYCFKDIDISSLIKPSLTLTDLTADVLISTPKILLKALNNHNNKSVFQNVKMMVLDEADLLLSFGFKSNIVSLKQYLPRTSQCFLMSATLNDKVKELKSIILHNPAVIRLDDTEAKKTINNNNNNNNDTENDDNEEIGTVEQYYIRTNELQRFSTEKFLYLHWIVKYRFPEQRVLVFFSNTMQAYKIKIALSTLGYKVGFITRRFPSDSRFHIIEEFNRGEFNILLAVDEEIYSLENQNQNNNNNNNSDEDNDISEDEDEDEDNQNNNSKSFKDLGILEFSEFGVSRGVDFKDVVCVINYNLPLSESTYVHRIGRTGRGGKSGTAISLVAPDEDDLLGIILDAHPNLRVYDINVQKVERWRYRLGDHLDGFKHSFVRKALAAEVKRQKANSEALMFKWHHNTQVLQKMMKRSSQTLDRVESIKADDLVRKVPWYFQEQQEDEALANEKAQEMKRKRKEEQDDAEEKARNAKRRRKRKYQDPLLSLKI